MGRVTPRPGVKFWVKLFPDSWWGRPAAPNRCFRGQKVVAEVHPCPGQEGSAKEEGNGVPFPRAGGGRATLMDTAAWRAGWTRLAWKGAEDEVDEAELGETKLTLLLLYHGPVHMAMSCPHRMQNWVAKDVQRTDRTQF